MKLLLLDANSLINRAFYGIKTLTTKDGQFTNGLFGFMNIMKKLRDEYEPEGIVAAFDVYAPTFRHEKYDQYKAGRRKMPDELAQQIPVLKELLTLMGCHVVEHTGYEADDILGTLSRAAHEQGHTCHIATGDRDALQLVSERVTVLLTVTKNGSPETVVYDPAAVFEKYGLTPAQLIDLKALMGDSGDNIPGVPGVGEKTALELMHRFGSLDGVYEGFEASDLRDTLKQKLAQGRDSAYQSRWLGTICCGVPVAADCEGYRINPVDRHRLAALLTKLEFYKMLEKMEPEITLPIVCNEDARNMPPVVENSDAVEELLADAAKTGRLDLLYTVEQNSISAYYCAFDGRAVCVRAGEHGFDKVTALLGDSGVKKRTSDVKTLSAALSRAGTQLAGAEMDVSLAGYLLNPLVSDYSVHRLAMEYAGCAFEDTGETAACIHTLPALADRLASELADKDMTGLLEQVELPLAQVLADMELAGFEADAQGIAAFGAQLEERIKTLQAGIYDAVGEEFNLNSPKQLAEMLFVRLELPHGKKTKTGYSTNAEVLEKLRDAHPAVSMLLDYRQLSKLKSTYCDGLLKVIGEDGRIHTSFNQTETRTGRISSLEPNLQNIPVRQETGRELRRFFRAREGWVLCDADYSQIELRVLAHMSGDQTMINAFNDDADIHRATAAQVFGVSETEVTPLMRSRAKAVNFGIVYGIGAHSLSQDIGVSYGEAKRYIEQYLNRFSGVSGFMEDMIAAAAQHGYAVTLFGRRRPLPELRASNAITRSFGERVARNMPVQGTAADIIKIAMVRVHSRLRRENLSARLILQVHDELIAEAPAHEAERVCALLKEEMESAASMSVRLEVDAHTGITWYDAKG